MLSKDPQTLDELIKQEHVYGKPSKENDNHKSSHKNSCPYNSNMDTSNTKKKCNPNNDTAMQGKKTKSTSQPLSKEDFECVKKENLCFLCMGNHSKRDFHTLKKARPQKDKQVHTVQVLPPELSSRYSQVQVSHMHVKHECHITSSMWQSMFGPHD